MNKNVFINCPFDNQYKPIFEAILYSIYFCGCKPRCALEVDNAAQNRLDKIFDIIEDCDLGIHDISRTELNYNNLPRFNMPFEMGLFFGARRYGSRKHKLKSCLVFDTQRFRYQEFISDIGGQDIKAHNNEPGQVIREIRNWLNTIPKISQLPGATIINRRYQAFREDWPYILSDMNLNEIDVEYSDLTQLIEEWIALNPI